jgi:hypothetical protein
VTVAEGEAPSRRLEAWLTRVTQHPLTTLAVCLVVAAAALYATATRLGVNSDAIAMLDEDLPFRQTDERLKREFPQLGDNLLAVVEAPTPEQATRAARRIAERLDGMPEVESLRWPAGSAFFARNGLLFLPLTELEQLADRLTEVQPLLGQLARETDAATLLEMLARIAARGDASGFDVEAVHDRVDAALGSALDGGDRLLSWQRLLGDAGDERAREVLLIRPVLDHGKVLAGGDVMRAVQALRAELGFDRGAVRLRFTGSTALQYEEMRSVIAGAGLTGLLALALVTTVMLAGLRSLSLSAIALANLLLGLVLTAGFAAVAIGRVNLISVSFVVLYIGLGVNYAVHYLLRYREVMQADPRRGVTAAAAAIATGRFLKKPLLLSAVTTALGFFAFVPTAFSGVAQLGLIAGVAMGITLALSYTALPAMLALFRPKVALALPDHGAGWRRALEWPLKRRGAVLALGAVLAAAALPALPELRFDDDPLNVRDPASESVVAVRGLLRDGEAGYRNIQVLLDADTEPEPMRRELAALSSVARAVTLASFVPADQDDKLFVLDDLRWVLGPGVVQADWQPDPVAPARLAEAAGTLEAALRDVEPVHPLADRLGRLQRALASPGAAPVAEAVNDALVGGLPVSLGRLSTGLAVDEPVTRDDLPDWLVEQWRGASGTQLVQVFPATDMLTDAGREAFTRDVVSVAGARATGGPVIQLAAGEAITSAFRQALVWAVIGIAAVLLVTLKSPLSAARVMLPLALGGLLTIAAMALLGISFNFANVVALPLLLGVAVDNGIHLVARHRAGLMPDGNVLKTATARAIVVGALITAGGFGNLAFSPHSGTASLGLILAIGLALMVTATLVFLPAMLGRSRQ